MRVFNDLIDTITIMFSDITDIQYMAAGLVLFSFFVAWVSTRNKE